jgi:hypothetical protein
MGIWQAGRLTVVFSLAWAVGCSRQLAVQGSSVPPAGSGQLPFARESDPAGISPTAAFAPDGVPIGTEITVRLQLILSSTDAHLGDSFAAVLDQPIVVAGQTVVLPGAPVTGTVLAAQACERLHDSGYLRVTLASITVNGKPLILQTSSIFAKGARHEKPKTTSGDPSTGQAPLAEMETDSAVRSPTSSPLNNGDVKFSTGHRFTFRLTEPLHLPG